MKIGIDCRTILNPGFGEGTAIGHYTYCLVQALVENDKANRFVLYFDDNLTDDAIAHMLGRENLNGTQNPHVTVRRFPFHEFSKWMPGAYEKTFIPALYAKDRLDILFEPSSNVSASFLGKKVVTVHSERELTPVARNAARIIVPSKFVHDTLVKHKVDPKKISIIPYGTTPHTFGAKTNFSLSERYILFIGTINASKNLHTLFRAFAKLVTEKPTENSDLTLAIAGLKGEGSEAIFAELERINMELESTLGRKPIHYLGYVGVEEKWQLLKDATIFAYPALEEGFGLSVLEAMSVGTPVLASNRGALPELVGSAGLLVNPEYTEEFYHALARLLKDPESRKHFSEVGKHRAALYTWEKAARETLHALHQATMAAK